MTYTVYQTDYDNPFFYDHCPNLVAQALAAGYVAEDDATDIDVVEFMNVVLLDKFEEFVRGRWEAKGVDLVDALIEGDGDFNKADDFLIHIDAPRVYDPYAHCNI